MSGAYSLKKGIAYSLKKGIAYSLKKGIAYSLQKQTKGEDKGMITTQNTNKTKIIKMFIAIVQ